MQGRALVQGIQAMIVFLVRAAIFPLAWVWAMGIAKRHEDTDPAARKKVAASIVAGLVLAAGVGYLLYDFQEDARTGMYDTFEGRMAQVYGENAYNDQTVNIVAKTTQVGAIGKNLVIAQEAFDAAVIAGNATAMEAEMTKVVDLTAALDLAERDLAAAQTYQARLQQEHAFFQSIHIHVVNQDDAALRNAVQQRFAASQPDAVLAPALLDAEKARDAAHKALDEAAVAVLALDLMEQAGMAVDPAERQEAEAALNQAQNDFPAARIDAQEALAALQDAGIEEPVPSDVYDSEKLPSRTDYWLAVKDDAEADMQQVMVFLLFPGVIGVFYAPIMVALGNVMANAWEPSSSVGYKKYPGLSLGLFLFFGAFGWPALLFSAWGFWDIDVRSKEGQIAL